MIAVSPVLTTFLFEAANFLVLAAVLGWLFFKPIRQALADHRADLETLAHQAAEKLAAAEQLRADVDHQRQALRDELGELRAETLALARREADKIVADARAQAQNTREAARQHLARLDETQTAALSRATAAAAGAVVERLLAQIDGPDLNDALLRVACRQLEALSLDAAPVTVETAKPMDEASRARLDAALGKAAATATHRVVVDLAGGVRVTTNRGLVDASIAGLADFAERALLAEMKGRPQGGANGR